MTTRTCRAGGTFAPAGVAPCVPYGRRPGFAKLFSPRWRCCFALGGGECADPADRRAWRQPDRRLWPCPPTRPFPAVLQTALRPRATTSKWSMAGFPATRPPALLARLDWALGDGADGAIVEIGANDMLRGLDPRATEKNIDAILARLRERKIPFLLAGMRAAPNLGGALCRPIRTALPGAGAKISTRRSIPSSSKASPAIPACNCPTACIPTAQGVEHRRRHTARDRRPGSTG